MRKAIIPVEITEEAIEIAQMVSDNGQEETVAVAKIQDLLTSKGLSYSDKTITRLMKEWKKSGSIRSIVESFDVNLQSPWRRTEYILSVLEAELRKSVDAKDDVYKKIRIADSMHKYIETEIKIEILRSKKTTTSTGSEESGKILVGNSIASITEKILT